MRAPAAEEGLVYDGGGGGSGEDGAGRGHADGPLDPRLPNVSSADPSGCTSKRQDLLEKGRLYFAALRFDCLSEGRSI